MKFSSAGLRNNENGLWPLPVVDELWRAKSNLDVARGPSSSSEARDVEGPASASISSSRSKGLKELRKDEKFGGLSRSGGSGAKIPSSARPRMVLEKGEGW